MGWFRFVFAFVVCGVCGVCAFDPKDARVLVTGGMGFIGSHVVDKLLSIGARAAMVDNGSNGNRRNPKARNVLMDISKEDEYYKLNLFDPTHVVHLAAAISVAESMTDPNKYERVNVGGSELMFEWAAQRGVNRIVTASSAAIYGDSAPLPIKEDSGFGGVSPYAKSKWEMEKLQHKMWNKHKLESVALRFFNVFGPRQDPHSPYSGVISKFMDNAAANRKLSIFGDGKQTRDFVFVDDIASAVVHALFTDKLQFPVSEDPENVIPAFNVCTGTETTINQLAEHVLNVASKETETPLSVVEMVEHLPAREGDIERSVCDPSKMREVLGFAPQVGFVQGLEQTWKWIHAEPEVPAQAHEEL